MQSKITHKQKIMFLRLSGWIYDACPIWASEADGDWEQIYIDHTWILPLAGSKNGEIITYFSARNIKNATKNAYRYALSH